MALAAVLTRGAGAAGIVGALIFSPMAMQAAQADQWSEGLKILTTVGGGVAAASPEVLGGAVTAEAGATAATVVACAASVICGGVMVAAGVGILALTTKDYWVPWVKSWGTGAPAVVGNGMPMNNVQVQAQWDRLPDADGAYVRFTTTVAGDRSATGNLLLHCHRPDGTTFYQQPWIASGDLNGVGFAVVGRSCGPVDRVVGAKFDTDSPATAAEPSLTWGDLGPATFDPSGSLVQTNKVCQRPDGTRYTDSRSISNATTSIPVGFCLPGDKAVSLGVTVTPPGGSPIVTQALPLTPTSGDLAKYPECAGAACEYQILIDGVPCRVGQAGCSEWYAMSQATPSRITGRYGPYAYDVGLLRWLQHAYDSSSGVAVTTTTGTANDPTQSPNPVAGVPGVAPDWFHVPVPIDGTKPMPNPVPTPKNNGDCFGGAVSWNPVDWVVTPVKCALAWAFVPSGPFVANWGGRFNADWTASAPGAWIASLGGMNFNIPSGGCEGPALPTGFMGEGWGAGTFHIAGPAPLPAELHPFAACTGVMATVAQTANLILTVGISFFGGMRVVQQLGYAFGFKVHAGSERSTFT